MNKAAQELGRLGGKSTSEAKRQASRENGKLGGRPKKQKRRKPNDALAGEHARRRHDQQAEREHGQDGHDHVERKRGGGAPSRDRSP